MVLPKLPLGIVTFVLGVLCLAQFIFSQTQQGEEKPRPLQVRLLGDSEASSNDAESHGSSEVHDSHGSSHAGAHHDYHVYPRLTFLIVCLLVGGLADHLHQKLPIKPPYTVILFVLGMLAGTLEQNRTHLGKQGSLVDALTEGISMFSEMDAHVMLFVFLPVLLYESASNMNWHVFRAVLPSSMLLAIPGVLLNVIMVGLVIHFGFDSKETPWSLPASFLAASILSATDPVAVVAALAALGAPKKLSSLIEGESLLNDGSAVVFFQVFLAMVTNTGCTTLPCIIRDFIRLALGGAIFGAASGSLMCWWLRHVRQLRSVVLEVAVVIVFVQGTFFIAESYPFKVSGVIATVSQGAVMSAGGHLSFSHHGAHAHHTVICQLAYLCNQSLFFIAGIITTRFMFPEEIEAIMWVHLLILYFLLHISRTIVTLIFSPFLKRHGYGITSKEMAMLVFGGLRGAVGLAMGLMVEANSVIDKKLAAAIVFHASGIVLLTLLVNGSSVEFVYKKLKLYPSNPFKVVYLHKGLKKLESECQESIEKAIAKDWFFAGVDIDALKVCLPDFTKVQMKHNSVEARGVKEVDEVLHSLEEEAEKFRDEHRKSAQACASTSVPQPPGPSPSHHHDKKEVVVNDPSKPKLTYAASSQLHATVLHWQEAKMEVETKASHYVRRWQSRKNPSVGEKDLFLRVRSAHGLGGKNLEYCGSAKELEQKVTGSYISARTLAEIKNGTEWCVIPKKHNKLIVGLFSQASFTSGFQSENAPKLGMAPYSVGFRCSDGMIIAHDGNKSREIPTDQSVDVGVKLKMLVNIELGDNDARGVKVWFVRCSDDVKLGEVFIPEVKETMRPACELDISLVDGKATGGGAKLSFCPQFFSAADSTHEMFIMLFTALRRTYKSLQDHGNLGQRPYLELCEALEQGEDTANHEENANEAAEMLVDIEKQTSTATWNLHTEDVTKGAEPWQAHIKSRMAKIRTKVQKDGPKQAWQSGDKQYEPLFVEYLALEQFLSEPSWWDRFESKWLRQYGYEKLKAKVEAIWAFVTAHDMMLEELPTLQEAANKTVPGLMGKLKEIIKQAKEDMINLENLAPRRFYYARHVMALRLITSIKLHKLEEFCNEGLLDANLVEELVESLSAKLNDVQRFHPGIQPMEHHHHHHEKSTEATPIHASNCAPPASPPASLPLSPASDINQDDSRVSEKSKVVLPVSPVEMNEVPGAINQ